MNRSQPGQGACWAEGTAGIQAPAGHKDWPSLRGPDMVNRIIVSNPAFPCSCMTPPRTCGVLLASGTHFSVVLMAGLIT